MSNEVIKSIQSHRSIRKFLDKRVEEEHVEQIIKSAQCAPTTRHMQAYTIIRVNDKNARQDIAKTCGKEFITNCPLFLMFCPDLRRIKEACGKHGYDFQTEYMNYFIIATVDATLAAQNAALAAESLGLGTVYIGGLRNDLDKICERLNIPEYVYPLVGLTIGYPGEDVDIKPRLPMDVVYKTDSYSTANEEKKLEEYDQLMTEYYAKRTQGQKHDSWTQKIAAEMESEKRPDMRDFLNKMGLAEK